MFNINEFLGRFKKIVKNDKDIKEIIKEIIFKKTNILIKEENITLKNNLIFIKEKPSLKNEIFLIKEDILRNLRKDMPNKFFTDLK